MNRFKAFIQIALTAILAYFLQMVLPWWSVAIAGFAISSIIYTESFTSFLTGFLGIGFLWFTLATIIDTQTGSILTDKVAAIFSLPNSWLLVMVTSTVGGIAGGFGALTGNYFRRWVMPTA